MSRNIWIAYILTICKNSWFWFGIWVFYYLRFTTYAGIGIIETVLIVTMTLAEIPTGAVADLLGKRTTLIMAFLLEAAGAWWFAFTSQFWGLVGSVFIMCVGGAFFSGTLEALVFDSLKQTGKEHTFDKIISKINATQLVTIAICSVLGGFFYTHYFRLPFILNALFYSLGIIAAFFLTEPKIDTQKFSLKNFFIQTGEGFTQLFKTVSVKVQTLLLLSVGIVLVILDEMLLGFLGVEFGYNEKALGIIWAGIYLLAALGSQLTPLLKQVLGINKALILIGLIIASLLLVSPFAGLMFGSIVLLLLSVFQFNYVNLTSIAINKTTESPYRATTLSTFNMLKNIPYMLLAYGFGFLADTYSARWSAFGLGWLLMILLLLQSLRLQIFPKAKPKHG